MNIQLTIKDRLFAQELEAVASMGGYTDTIADPTFVSTETEPVKMIANPVTKEQFMKQQIKAWLRNQTIEHAVRTAMQTAVTSVETE